VSLRTSTTTTTTTTILYLGQLCCVGVYFGKSLSWKFCKLVTIQSPDVQVNAAQTQPVARRSLRKIMHIISCHMANALLPGRKRACVTDFAADAHGLCLPIQKTPVVFF
jgi:hypothetical protein